MSEPRRILVVEDDTAAREALRTLLETYGHQVDEAPDGAMAIAKALATRPDIIFLDIGMPGLDGFEVAKRLAYDGHRPFVVGLTGHGQDKDFARARRGGFDAYVVKPADIDELLRLIDRASAELARAK